MDFVYTDFINTASKPDSNGNTFIIDTPFLISEIEKTKLCEDLQLVSVFENNGVISGKYKITGDITGIQGKFPLLTLQCEHFNEDVFKINGLTIDGLTDYHADEGVKGFRYEF